jgi:uncharacterized coiled-coil DUF342 family protein
MSTPNQTTVLSGAAVAPTPQITTEVKFTIDQNSIVDGAIANAITPLRARQEKLGEEVRKLEVEQYGLRQEYNPILEGIGQQAIVDYRKKAEEFFGDFLSPGKQLWLTARARTCESSYNDSGISHVRVELSINEVVSSLTREQLEDPDFDYDVEELTILEKRVPVPQEMEKVLKDIEANHKKQRALNAEIQNITVEINRITNSRGKMMAQLNQRLLLESPHGVAMMTALSGVMGIDAKQLLG